MPKSAAVLAIHGIGSQGARKPASTRTLSFSKELANFVAREIGADKFNDNVAWHEAFWADVLQTRQENYLRKIKRRTRGDELRSYVLTNLSDASAYRQTPDGNDKTYETIHARIDRAMADLEQRIDPGAPLIVLAHSLGGHIMSNYFYDRQAHPDPAQSSFRNMQQTMAFVTFGCNIPLFVFAYPPDKVRPIKRPGTALLPKHRLVSWWRNIYDKDDILGFPLRDIGPRYRALVDRKELEETAINAGGLFNSWNPLSHNAYWKDPDFFRRVARLLNHALR